MHETWNRAVARAGGSAPLEHASEEQVAVEVLGLDLRPTRSERWKASASQGLIWGGIVIAGSIGTCAVVFSVLWALTTPASVQFPLYIRGSNAVQTAAASVAQIVVTALFLVLALVDRRRCAPLMRHHDIVPEVWRQFLRGWAALWCSWLLLYVTILLSAVFPGEASRLSTTEFSIQWLWIREAINSLSSFALIYLFLVLDRPSVSTQEDPRRNQRFKMNLVCVAVICVSATFLACLGHTRSFAGAQPLTWCTPILASISMMYLFAGLAYRPLNIARSRLAPLFLYGALQMLWPVVQSGGGNGAAWITQNQHFLVWIALLLKVYLFFLVRNWVVTDQLEKYLEGVQWHSGIFGERTSESTAGATSEHTLK